MSSSPGWGWAVGGSGSSALATGSPCPKPRPHHHLPSWGLVFFTGQRGSSLPTPNPHHSDVGVKLEERGGESFTGSKGRRAGTTPYHRAQDCRAVRGVSPQHRGHPHSWVGGSSSCGSSETGPLRSSGHTRTRDSSVTSLQALNGEEKGRTRGLAQAGTPTCPPSPGRGPMLEMEGPEVGRGTDVKEGQSRRALTTHHTWASPQVAEAAFLVGCKHIGAPVSAGPWGVVGPQAALLACPTAAGAWLPWGPSGPGTVPGHAAGAGAQGQLCGWNRTTLSCSQSPDPQPPFHSSSADFLGRGWLCPILPPFQI